ncbi:MAG: D-alanine--D-alanine ligase [Planctomycetota bacterium]|nr:D-alanine--D-alanine ligase [Planctomycetota bacterium]MDA1162486.1 D-alanine--D-alanine ligase [Planctomycetota bacterium]
MEGILHTPLKPLRVAVLAGGDSAERQISLQSGAVVAAALAARGHAVSTVDPAETSLETFDWNTVDVAFLALHGTFGEDGSAQLILSRQGVVFTGSDSEASKLAFSKSAAKERFALSGISTPEFALVHESDDFSRIIEQATSIGFPLVVKPDRQGSSLGVVMVADEPVLAEAVNQSFSLDSFCLLERTIVGAEWTLGVIDEEPLPLIRIGTDHKFFDFEAKYSDDSTSYHMDETIDPVLREGLITIGLQACRALGTKGVARVDIMVDAAGKPWVLEVNTIPGMTDHSLVPKAAAKLGLDMGQLCELVIERALHIGQRQRRRAS